MLAQDPALPDGALAGVFEIVVHAELAGVGLRPRDPAVDPIASELHLKDMAVLEVGRAAFPGLGVGDMAELFDARGGLGRHA